MEARLARLAAAGPAAVEARLQELDAEWSAGRVAKAVLSIAILLGTILANYPDYFPPDFDSLFLRGREATFAGLYRAAFYVHIFSGPLVLVNGLVLLSETVRRRSPGLHRILGRVQVVVLLVLMLPSATVMSRHAFGGWPSGFARIRPRPICR